jgi:Fur family peroxide stress response transcriptional regulator
MGELRIDQEELQRRIKRFEAALRSAGIKRTHQRIEVFKEVARTGEHPDAQTVYRRVARRIPSISLDTVYRTLWLFKDLGLINTLGTNQERIRFDANTGPHHHFICTRCGKTVDFQSTEFDGLAIPKEVRAVGRVESNHIELRGVCAACMLEGEKT